MPLKPQSKEIEDILHAIQDRLSAIQIHMESQEQRQDAIEAKQESLQSSLSALLEQVSSLTPSGSSSSSIPYISPYSMAKHTTPRPWQHNLFTILFLPPTTTY